MINITLTVDSHKRVVKVESKGHGEYAEYGKDIVCSAVSVYLINTINTLTEILDVEESINYIIDDGFYDLNIDYKNIEESKREFVVLILNSLKLALESLQENYEQYISVNYREVR